LFGILSAKIVKNNLVSTDLKDKHKRAALRTQREKSISKGHR